MTLTRIGRIVFNLLILLWLVVALGQARDSDDPVSPPGAWMVIFIWVAGAVLLGVAWLVFSRDKHRPRHRRPR